MHRLLLPSLLLLAGCGQSGPDYTEQKRIDEFLDDRDVAVFLRITEELPEPRLEVMEQVFAPLPNWDRTRTLPVAELLRLERESLDARRDVDRLVKRQKPSRRLKRLLEREQMTHGQYVALALSIGAALRRSTLRPEQEQELTEIVEKGRERSRPLEADQRPFASLPPDDQYRTLQQAAWLVRSQRAEWLDRVPPENVEVVLGFRERLAAVYPPEFIENPFDGILDPLEEYGIPYRERTGDEPLAWNRSDAIVGTDAPDPEFETRSAKNRPAVDRLLRRDPDVAAAE